MTTSPPWGVIDQVLSAGTNAVVVIVGARALSPGDLGIFSTAISVALIVIVVGRSWTSQPLMIRYSGAHADDRATQSALAIAGLVRVVIPLVAVGCAIAPLFGANLQVVVALSVGLAVLLIQDLLRYVFFVVGPPWGAAVSDGVWLMVIVALLVIPLPRNDAADLVVLWCFGALMAALVSLLQLGLLPQIFHSIYLRVPWFRDHRSLGWSLLADTTLVTLYGYSIPLQLTLLSTVAEAGRYRVAMTIMGPPSVIMLGAATQLLPRMVRTSETQLMASMAKQATARYALISALYAVALLLTPTAIGEAIIGSAWVDIKPTALALGLSSVGGAVVMGPLVLLRAIGMTTQLARLRLSLFPMQLALVVLGVLWGGAVGAALGLAGGSWLSAPFWWVLARKHTGDYYTGNGEALDSAPK